MKVETIIVSVFHVIAIAGLLVIAIFFLFPDWFQFQVSLDFSGMRLWDVVPRWLAP